MQACGSGSASVGAPAQPTTETVTLNKSTVDVAISPDASRAYITGSLRDRGTDVSVIDTARPTAPPTTITLDQVGFPNGIAISSDGTRAYIVDNLTGNLFIIDTARLNEVPEKIAIGGRPA